MSRSVEILKNLKDRVGKGTLPPGQFPVKDVAELIYAEHKGWLDGLAQQISEYESIYEKGIGMASSKGEKEMLVRMIGELADDLETIDGNGVFLDRERLKRVEEDTEWPMVREFQKYAKKAYETYPFHDRSSENAFLGKGVIYTVVIGGYDALCAPEYRDEGFDYICFTDDRSLTSDVWTMRYVENEEGLDPARLSRKYKILCHEFLEEYDFSIYIDGKVQIIGDLWKYMETYSRGSSMLCFPHFVRECAYEEARVCASIGKDDPEIIRRQMEGYAREGYPERNGLTDCACMIRQHYDTVLQRVMECWWREVKNKSRRDQLSFGYACWKNGFHYDLCDLYTYKNEYLRKNRSWEKPY